MARSKSKKSLVVVSATSEMVPFSKTGGLADVAGALPQALARLGHTLISFVPGYPSAEPFLARARKAGGISVPLGGTRKEEARLWKYHEREGHTIYLIEHKGFFERSGLYGEKGTDYADNGLRFAFFSRAVLEALLSLDLPQPDALHVHDWQTALIPVYLKEVYRSAPHLSATPVLFTVHNAAYQGLFPREILHEIGLPDTLFHPEKLEFWGKLSYFKGGLVYADRLNTVSPAYAEEVQGPACGAGLEGIFVQRKRDLSGVLNGLDTNEWNPEDDPHIKQHFSMKDLSGKQQNKAALQKEFGLPVTSDMLFAFVGRLAEQKGIDILLEALPALVRMPIQIAVLGAGDPRYQDALVALGNKFPEKISTKAEFNDDRAHRMYAGADAFLMPSRFEPCGLGQLISFRYGTVPVARQTGGLKDTIAPLSDDWSAGNGFLFQEYRSAALVDAVNRAVNGYQNNAAWKTLSARIMELDFSWKKSAEAYVDLYRRLMVGA